jgi:hypothetical protein
MAAALSDRVESSVNIAAPSRWSPEKGVAAGASEGRDESLLADATSTIRR